MSLHDSIDKSFRDSDAKKLTEVLIRGEPELRTAKDWGLASQLIDCLSKRRIVDISNSYSNLPLIKLATLLGSSISNGDLESMLVDIFVRNIIHGRIDSVKGVVYFDSGTSLSGVADDKKESLLKKIKEIECLSDRLREMKAHVLASPAYLLKQRSIK